jgi:peptidoglycan hydrolase CwlO-like protein
MDIVMITRKPFFLAITAISVLAVISYFYFYNTSISIQEPTPDQDIKEHQKKLVEFDTYLNKQQSKIDELDQVSDRLKEKDRINDERLRQLDEELGLTPEEFDKKYPGFNMDGDNQ